MSHVTTIKCKIKNLEALREACKKIGLVFRENQKTYKWWGYSVGDYPIPVGLKKEDLGKCDHAIGLAGNSQAYEIGLLKREDEYMMVWDFYGGARGLEEVVGKDCCNLTEAYTKIVALKEATTFARNQGWSVTEEYDQQTSETVLRLRKY